MSDELRTTELEGIRVFGSVMAQLKCLVREVWQHDKGIDIDLELPRTRTCNGKTPFIGVQVKTRTNLKALKNGCFSITVKAQNLDYWRSYGRPVVFVLYDPSQGKMYWKRVDNSITRTIHIDPANFISEATLGEFRQLCDEYIIHSAKTLSLLTFNPSLASVTDTFGALGDTIVKKIETAYGLFEEAKYRSAAEELEPIVKIFASRELLGNITLSMSLAAMPAALDYAEKLLTFDNLTAFELEVAASTIAWYDDFGRAKALFWRAIQTNPDPNIKANFALACYWNGDYSEAASLYRDLIEADFVDDRLCFNLALLSTATGNFEEAIKFYLTAIEINPELIDAYNNCGLLFQELGKHALAEKYFGLGLSKDSSYVPLLANLALLLKDYGADDKALGLLNYASTLEVRDDFIQNQALILCRQGKLDEAGALFNSIRKSLFQSITKNPEKEESRVRFFDAGFSVIYAVDLILKPDVIVVDTVLDLSEQSLVNIFVKKADEIGVPRADFLELAFRSDNPRAKFVLRKPIRNE